MLCMTDFGYLEFIATLWESIDSHSYIGLVATWVQSAIILPSWRFKPANITFLWIEEGLIYTSVCQIFKLVAVARTFLVQLLVGIGSINSIR